MLATRMLLTPSSCSGGCQHSLPSSLSPHQPPLLKSLPLARVMAIAIPLAMNTLPLLQNPSKAASTFCVEASHLAPHRHPHQSIPSPTSTSSGRLQATCISRVTPLPTPFHISLGVRTHGPASPTTRCSIWRRDILGGSIRLASFTSKHP